MKNFKISLLLIFGFVSLCCKKAEIKFISIKSLNYENTVNNGIRDFTNKSVYYLIDGYENNKEAEAQIDSFVNLNKDKGFERFDNYGLVFYKQSSETTIENIERNPKIIDRYSNKNDLIFEYNWSKGVFVSKYKFKNGLIIEPKGNEVILSPAPPLQDSIK